MSDRMFLAVFASGAYLFAGVIGAGGIILRWRIRRSLKSTKGTIVSIERSATMSSGGVYPITIPHFRFTDTNGVEHFFASSESEQPESFKVGDVVEIFYDPASPQYVFIEPKRIKKLSSVCIFAASFAVLVGTIIFTLVLFRVV